MSYESKSGIATKTKKVYYMLLLRASYFGEVTNYQISICASQIQSSLYFS